MRALQHLGDTFLDFVETHRFGAAAFKAARYGLFALVVVLGGKIAAGQFLSVSWHDVLFMAIAFISFLIVTLRWEVGMAFIVASTAFIFHPDSIPTLSLYHFVPEIAWLEPNRLLLGQAILVLLLLLFAQSRQSASARARLATPLSGAVVGFVLVIAAASVAGVVFNDVPYHFMVDQSRPYSFYLMFVITLLCLKNRQNLNLLLVMITVMAVIVGIGMVLQFFSGDRVHIFFGYGRVETFGRFAGRVLPPGQALVWLAIPVLMAVIPTQLARRRAWLQLALGTCAVGLLLTFTRAMWMGTLAGVLFMVAVGSGRERSGMFRIFLLFAGCITLLLLLLGTISTQSENYMMAYVERFTSTFRADSYDEASTVGARLKEIRAAWSQIIQHPWLGIGVGAMYDYEATWDQATFSHVLLGISYIHNSYIGILCKTGVAGLTALVVMFTVYFVRAWKIYRMMQSHYEQALVMGGMGMTVSCLVGSLLQPSLSTPGPVSLLGLMWGVTEFLRWTSERGQEREQMPRGRKSRFV